MSFVPRLNRKDKENASCIYSFFHPDCIHWLSAMCQMLRTPWLTRHVLALGSSQAAAEKQARKPQMTVQCDENQSRVVHNPGFPNFLKQVGWRSQVGGKCISQKASKRKWSMSSLKNPVISTWRKDVSSKRIRKLKEMEPWESVE